MRIPWEVTFMRVAVEIAKRSHCVQIKVGAVIANMKPGEQAILSTGYNGPSRGIEHCDENECNRRGPSGRRKYKGQCMGAHAEMNAIINAARAGVSIEGASLFVTCSPCMECAKGILNSGMIRLVYLDLYSEIFTDKKEEAEMANTLLTGKIKCYMLPKKMWKEY